MQARQHGSMMRCGLRHTCSDLTLASSSSMVMRNSLTCCTVWVMFVSTSFYFDLIMFLGAYINDEGIATREIYLSIAIAQDSFHVGEESIVAF